MLAATGWSVGFRKQLSLNNFMLLTPKSNIDNGFLLNELKADLR